MKRTLKSVRRCVPWMLALATAAVTFAIAACAAPTNFDAPDLAPEDLAAFEAPLWNAGGLPTGIAAFGAGSLAGSGSEALQLFFRAPDGQLAARTKGPSGWSTANQTIGTEILASDPSAVMWSPRRTDVFYRTSAGLLGQAGRDLDYGGGIWFSVVHPDRIASAPAVTSRNPGTLDVFFADAGGRIFVKIWDGRWKTPKLVAAPGSPIVGPIAATAVDARTVRLLGRRADGEVEIWRWVIDDDGETPMITSEGTVPGASGATSIAAASFAGDRFDVFHVRGSELRWRVQSDFHPAGYEQVLATDAESVCAVSVTEGVIELAYRNTAGILQHRRYTNGLLLGANPPSSFRTIPLYSWWSAAHGDGFTTSNPAWAPDGNTRTPDYAFRRYEGLVFDPAGPQPPDTVPLYSWWSGSRADNYLTTDPGWAGGPGATRSPDYQFVRFEGYVYRNPVMGTLPLRSWWHPGLGDNKATTDPEWSGRNGREGYTPYRTEGYVLPDPRGARASDELARKLGYNAWPLKGVRPLLHLSAHWANGARPRTTALDEEQNRKLIFGTATASPSAPRTSPNLIDYALENSKGLFTFTPAAPTVAVEVAAPVPTTGKLLGDPTEGRPRALMVVKADRTLPFDRFDVNRDRVIDNGELAIVITDNLTSAGGANRAVNGCCKAVASDVCLGVDPGTDFCRLDDEKIALHDTTDCVQPYGRNYKICTRTGAVAYERKRFDLIAHELFHSFGAQDIYGSSSPSKNLSLMNSGGVTVHLDPIHKIRWGWVRPRAVAVSAPPTILQVEPQSADDTDASAPIALVDPDGEPGSQRFYVIEARSRAQTARAKYDLGASGDGVVLWYNQWLSPTEFHGAVIADCGSGRVIVPISIGSADHTCHGRFGNNQPWTESTPEAQPFLGGHASTKIAVRRHPSKRAFFVQVRQDSAELRPRIDAVGASSIFGAGRAGALSRGGVATSTGVFPFDGTTFQLTNGGLAELLSSTAFRASLRVGSDAPLGATRLRAAVPGGWLWTFGNQLPVTVE